MTPTTIELAELTKIALEAATVAGKLVHAAWRKYPIAERKGRIDLVTEWDRRSEACIAEFLAKRAPFPIIGEEGTGHTRTATEAPTWYVDPIDGTTNFVHGHPFYNVSVGLAQNGNPLLGAVVAPALGICWTGYAGGPAERNGETCFVSKVNDLDDALVATGFPYDRRTNPDNNLAPFIHMKTKLLGARRCGAAAIDLCFVADGTYDAYWERTVRPWDITAGAAIVRAAGGIVTHYSGAPFNVAEPHLLAANALLHPHILAELKKAPLTFE